MAWLGCICDVSHRFVFQMDKKHVTCVVGGFHFNDSSVLAIEYKICSVPGHSLHYYLSAVKATEPKFITTFDFMNGNILGCKYVFHSWVKQCEGFQMQETIVVRGCRMFLEGDWKSLKSLEQKKDAQTHACAHALVEPG